MTTSIVLIGITGVGKSTVGRALERRLSWAYADGDDFHSPANVAKMSSGIPLTDDDRLPWLTSIATWIGEREAAGVDCIVTCSALRRSYRAFIREGHPSVWFAHLVAPPELVAERLAARTDHFMAPSLLGSQLDLLEDLEASERGARFAASSRPDRTADQICAYLEANGLLRQDGR